jgi:hypothetical protein
LPSIVAPNRVSKIQKLITEDIDKPMIKGNDRSDDFAPPDDKSTSLYKKSKLSPVLDDARTVAIHSNNLNDKTKRDSRGNSELKISNSLSQSGLATY